MEIEDFDEPEVAETMLETSEAPEVMPEETPEIVEISEEPELTEVEE